MITITSSDATGYSIGQTLVSDDLGETFRELTVLDRLRMATHPPEMIITGVSGDTITVRSTTRLEKFSSDGL